MFVLLTCSEVASNRNWQKLVASLLETSFQVADLVAPVVTSSSPEGQTVDRSDGKGISLYWFVVLV